MAYNQTIKQKEFNSDYTQTDWESDCLVCANDVHNVNEPIPHDCYMCAEFAPQTTTYNYLDFISYLLVPILIYLIVRLFIKKKK